MQKHARLIASAAVVLAGLVHAFDALDASRACPLESARAHAEAAQSANEPVDFLFAPASVWRHLAQERDVEALARRDVRP